MHAEVPNKAESSSDAEEAAVEPTPGDSGQVDPRQAACDQAEDQLAAQPDPSGLDSERGEEHKEDGDGLKQVCDPRLNPKYAVM